MVFQDRQEAGKKLALKLYRYKGEKPYILALPRGGVPVGFEMAEVLQAPLDVIVVRKIGLSGNREFGIGAIAEGGVEVMDEASIEALGIEEDKIKDTVELEEKELERRVKVYRGNESLPQLTDKTAILVDDGMATGITAKAAIEGVKKLNPKKIVLASPVCPIDTAESLQRKVDEVVCLVMPNDFMAVGAWYRNFIQISDEEVIDLLNKSKKFK